MNKGAGNGKRRLLEAAGKAFAQNGYAAVGVAHILEGAGVQAPTLYHHYGDKEGLYLAWACAELAKIEKRTESISDSTHPTESALGEFAELLTQHLPFDLRQLLRDAERLQRPESHERILAAYLQAIYNPLYGIIVRGISKGDIKPEPIGLLAETFIAGSLALGKHGWRSAENSEHGAVWWTRIFLKGCGKV